MHKVWSNWQVTTDDGCVHYIYADSAWSAMRKIEERNYYRIKATDARRCA